MKALEFLRILCILAWVPAFSKPILVDIPGQPSMTINQTLLYLNGIGLYRRFFFPVYKVYLYTENPTQDALEIIESKETKYAEMHFLRDVSSEAIKKAWLEVFEEQCAPLCQNLKSKMELFLNEVPDMKKGDYFKFVFLPNQLSIGKAGLGSLEIEGSDFVRFQLSVWLGDNPPSKSFKKGLLEFTAKPLKIRSLHSGAP